MATGDHDWTAGEQVTAANMDDYLQLQTVEQFATAAARDAALSARKREGMVTHQADTNTLTVYSGAAWSTIGPIHGAMTAWAPTITQSGTVTYTTTIGTSSRVGRRVFFEGMFIITGTGSASNVVTVTLPVTAAQSNSNYVIGPYSYMWDNSAALAYGFIPTLASSTTFKLLVPPLGGTALASLGTTNFTAALAANDFIVVSGNYEAAADA